MTLAVMPVVALGLTGCVVPSGGVTGLSIDASGEPVAVLAVCKGKVDTVTLLRSSDEIGRWTTSSEVRERADVPLGTPPPSWTTVTPLPPLKDRTNYSLVGGTEDDSWTLDGVNFTKKDVDRLRPGVVLYNAPGDDDPGLVTGTLARFRDEVCASF